MHHGKRRTIRRSAGSFSRGYRPGRSRGPARPIVRAFRDGASGGYRAWPRGCAGNRRGAWWNRASCPPPRWDHLHHRAAMATILIVDDDAALREGMAEALVDMGHRAVEAPDGDVALAIAARERVDAVLLDLRIPRMDGLEILRQLQSRPDRSPPVAILTAYASAANTIEAMRLGAFDHLTKPIGRDDLISLISRMLRSRSDAPPPAAPHVDEEELVGPSDAAHSPEDDRPRHGQ